jgi:hypothetical protein
MKSAVQNEILTHSTSGREIIFAAGIDHPVQTAVLQSLKKAGRNHLPQ